MKTKLFAIAAAAALFAASCTEAELQTPAGAGQEVTVSFQVNAPEAIATKAFSDGLTAENLTAVVYAEGSATPLLTETAVFENLKTKVEFTLVTGKKYDVLFWAQSGTAVYAFNPDTQEVTADYTNLKANDESLDAFFHAEKGYQVTGPKTEDIVLRRPFAQVNVGTNDTEEAKAAGYTAKQTNMGVKDVPNVLNLHSGAVRIENATENYINFAPAAIPEGETFPMEGYDYLAMNYILAGAEKTTTTVDFVIYGENEIPFHITNVPVQRNYRTNIYGALITDPTVWNVEINPAYKTPDFNHDLAEVSTAEELVNALTNGESVKLMENITFAEQITVTNSAVLDLNGKDLAYTGYDAANELTTMSAILVKSAELTVVGTGSFTSNGYVFNTSSQGTGGTINLDGDIEYKSTNATVLQVGNNGKATITAGTFSLEGSDKTFLLNKVDNRENDIIVKGGTFNGFNPADNKAEGANTNYVPEGYVSVKVGETYFVEKGTEGFGVETEEELATALAYNTEELVIILGNNVSLKDEFINVGTANTKSVKIKGATAEVEWTLTNSYLARIQLVNKAATLYVEDLIINGTRPDGTWDIYDVNFNSGNVVMNNVVFTKSVALTNGCKAVMNNVTITESKNEAYALWLSVGTDVTLNNCSINGTAAAARAIKIADQYVEEPKLTKLNISNTSFVSNKKAAILVTSKVKTEITLDNIDITGVVADSTNAVWVDSDNADYADLVTVTGGTKIVEK